MCLMSYKDFLLLLLTGCRKIMQMKIQSEILNYYESGVEEKRLTQGVFNLERVRTQELIARLLPAPKCKILDIGAGAGFYSFWLKKLGHEVHFVDLSHKNVDLAKRRERKLSKLASINNADARKLPYADKKFDVVLLLGPLYHITEKAERLKALYEAKRVLVKGGVLITAGITRYGSLFEGFFHGGLKLKGFIPMMNQDIKNGQHRNKSKRFDFFTTAYFHHPEELENEISEAGFKFEKLLAIESFGWLVPDFDKIWSQASHRQLLLNTIRRTESDASLMGLSVHIMAVGIKK